MFQDLGYNPIPLRANSKVPFRKNWPDQDINEQWRNCPSECNIGIRAGGSINAAFLDLDEKNKPGTFETATNFLKGLGINPGEYPVTKTASGHGRHIYLQLLNVLDGNVRKFLPDFGDGDFRFGCGAMVVAPNSVVGKQEYSLISGDYSRRPIISFADIKPILVDQSGFRPTRRKINYIPKRTWDLIHGDGINRYHSRSEADQAIITSLINLKFNYQKILDIFRTYPCAGRFQYMYQKSKISAEKYLLTCYRAGLEFTQNNESKKRLDILSIKNWVETRHWLGRSGITCQAVLLAHCEIAFRSGSLQYNASCRELAELAGVSLGTASSITTRLVNEKYLELTRVSAANYAAEYKFGDKVKHFLTGGG